jgi:hypothetical protein
LIIVEPDSGEIGGILKSFIASLDSVHFRIAKLKKINQTKVQSMDKYLFVGIAAPLYPE